MLKVEHLVDNRPLAEALLENWRYDLDDPSRFENFRISSNAIYPFHADGELQFLRFAPASEKRAGSVQAELDFIAYLRASGYPAAEPVPGKSGEPVVQQETPWGTYVASVFRRVPGVQLGSTDFSEEIVGGYGAALGALHWLSERYTAPGTRRWNHEAVLRWCSETLATFPDTPAAVAEAEFLARHFDGITKIGIYGLVHYDFECDNVLYDATTKTFGVIDFDDSMEHWYAMDLEQALDSLAEESGRDLSSSFLAGYASQRPITDDLIVLRPACRRFADLFWYTRTRRAVATVQPNEPEWLIGLRARIADGMARRAANFGTLLDHP
jgi:Ser/Thr protein kinase RdoA (MazF antagonist)